MIYRLVAKNEFDTPKILAMLNDDAKIRRLSKLYEIDEILDVLGYNDDSMDTRVGECYISYGYH